MASPRKPSGVRVDATVHRKAHRTNIPTAELEAFAEEHEKKPKTLLYPRDLSLDPQLVWKGKDEQDRSDLAVPAVPIYIQEKISPQALIEELRAERKRNASEQQVDLFGAFNGLEFEQLVDFYQHNQQWTNRMVLGDSLLVMASLAEKEGLKGKVQMIYMDPPYGIKFGSNWQVSTRKRDVHDGRPEDATRQPEQIRAFRDTWELAVHSYLAYLRDRLTVARDLLTESGSIFLQIGDQNVHLVRSILDEVFGSNNFIATVTFKTGSGFVGRYIKTTSDYLLWYGANSEVSKFHRLFTSKAAGTDTYFDKVQLSDGTVQDFSDDGEIPSDATPVALRPLVSAYSPNTNYRYTFRGHEYYCGVARCWKTTPDGMDRLTADNRIVASDNTLKFVARLSDFPFAEITHVWDDTMELLAKRFVVQTTTKVIERCILMTTDPGDLVLDPTCGSGTTAYVAEQWGRRWITIDTSRVALALARTRLMAARFPYYVLADSEAGATKQAELEGRIPEHSGTFSSDV